MSANLHNLKLMKNKLKKKVYLQKTINEKIYSIFPTNVLCKFV